jgi:cytidine deaminase
LAFVAPSGTNRELVLETAEKLLRQRHYDSKRIRLSDILELRIPEANGRRTVSERATLLQNEGDEVCKAIAKRADAMAFVAVDQIREARVAIHKSRPVPEGQSRGGQSDVAAESAYLIWSLKRPAELRTLRAIYRTRFFVVSIHTPLQTRLERLIGDEADALGHFEAEPDDRSHAQQVIERDEREGGPDREFNQDVSETYPMADFFVDASSRDLLKSTLGRSMDIIFGDPFATPTRAEYGMFLAHAAALKSAELGRQVGAALLTEDGDVVSTGANEVAKPSGGHFWAGDPNDDREFIAGIDSSSRMRARIAAAIIDAVAQVVEEHGEPDRAGLEKALAATPVDDLIEFGRAVHAEMDALVSAARMGRSVRDCNLYVTTFPCHLCTRLVISAGAKRVEYIYPYPKSLADALYGKQIDTEKGGAQVPGRIPFRPFIGVAPRRYQAAFTMPDKRKDSKGVVLPGQGIPRLLIEDQDGDWDLSTHIPREDHALGMADWLKEAYKQMSSKAKEE